MRVAGFDQLKAPDKLHQWFAKPPVSAFDSYRGVKMIATNTSVARQSCVASGLLME